MLERGQSLLRTSREGGPTMLRGRSSRSAFERPRPVLQSRMLGGPDQHGHGDGEIIMLSCGTGVNLTALPMLHFKLGQLVKGTTNIWILRESKLVRLQL